MHRSGTSLITNWLHKCGLQVGDDLLGADTGNDNGHFEDLDFLNSHKALLKARRLSDNGFTANPLKPLSYEENDKLKDIISYKNGFNQEWGWKDPRTCLFLDVYNELIPDAFYFVVQRDYQSVISSLVYRMYKQTERKYASKKGIAGFIWKHIIKKNRMEWLRKKYCQRYLQIWIAYNQAILQHIKRLPAHNYIIADYAILSVNDKFIFDHLVNTWGFTLHFFDFKKIYNPGQLNESFNTDAYIKDKSLISKAIYIEESLRQKSVLNLLAAPLAAG
jgi:hypothetical protein